MARSTKIVRLIFSVFSVIVVAEDVSLTGGAASQRIRLIDEEEQVCLHCFDCLCYMYVINLKLFIFIDVLIR